MIIGPTRARPNGIGYAAYSEVAQSPIVITLIKVDDHYRYIVEGPTNLAHTSRGGYKPEGDQSLSEAATRALKALTPGRTWKFRHDLFRQWAEAIDRGEISPEEPKPKLPLTIRTSSETLAQLGGYFSANRRVGTKRGRLEPHMRTLHRELHRFNTRWELLSETAPVPLNPMS